jgi:hypothetical protein
MDVLQMEEISELESTEFILKFSSNPFKFKYDQGLSSAFIKVSNFNSNLYYVYNEIQKEEENLKPIIVKTTNTESKRERTKKGET